MRKYKTFRSRYKTAARKKVVKKVVIRILFVLLCIAVLTAFAVFLGRRLNEWSDTVESFMDTTEINTEPPESTERFPDGVPSEPDTEYLAVRSAFIDLSLETPESVREKIDSLSGEYNAVTVSLTSDDGRLIYVSPALIDYVGMDSSAIEKLPEDDGESANAYDTLKALISASHERSLRVCASFAADRTVLSDSVESGARRLIDRVIFAELDTIGFDEVLITGLVADDEDFDTLKIKAIVSYLSVLRQDSADLDIGTVLPSEVYLTPSNASLIATLAKYTDLSAMHVNSELDDPEAIYSSIYDNYHSIKGSFSVYNIRAVITETDTAKASAIWSAMKDLFNGSIQMSVYMEDPITAEEEESSAEDTEDTTDIYNENANRKDTYENETEVITDTEASE